MYRSVLLSLFSVSMLFMFCFLHLSATFHEIVSINVMNKTECKRLHVTLQYIDSKTSHGHYILYQWNGQAHNI